MEPIPDGMMITLVLAIISMVGLSITAVVLHIQENRRKKHKKQ